MSLESRELFPFRMRERKVCRTFLRRSTNGSRRGPVDGASLHTRVAVLQRA